MVRIVQVEPVGPDALTVYKKPDGIRFSEDHAMLKSYEALLDHGQIRWLETPPDLETARLIVTVMPSTHTEPVLTEQVDQLLSRTAGAWGKRPSSELKALLAKQRLADWGDD